MSRPCQERIFQIRAKSAKSEPNPCQIRTKSASPPSKSAQIRQIRLSAKSAPLPLVCHPRIWRIWLPRYPCHLRPPRLLGSSLCAPSPCFHAPLVHPPLAMRMLARRCGRARWSKKASKKLSGTLEGFASCAMGEGSGRGETPLARVLSLPPHHPANNRYARQIIFCTAENTGYFLQGKKCERGEMLSIQVAPHEIAISSRKQLLSTHLELQPRLPAGLSTSSQRTIFSLNQH